MSEPAYPDALPALSRLHWYVVERVLGQGGFGITYLARDTNLDQTVAIKEYLPVDVATRMKDATIRSRSDDLRDRYRWGLERFIQEARTLARFDHPNIVRVQSVFEFNNTAYMVMRFEHGQTLSALLDRRGTLPEQELLRIVLPILDGLELVHVAGFIHRDIKPDNVHINEDGEPVLLDFGSARQALGTSHTLTILIAPGYAPFEQYYSDSSCQGPWTDIYGLGATCYRAISGRAPLDAVSRSKGILGSTQEVLVPASVIGAGRYSGKFLAAIDHALAFAEKDRPQTIEAWRQELAAGPAPPPAATEIVAAPSTSVRPSTGISASAVATDRLGAATGPKSTTQVSTPVEGRDSRQFVRSGDRRSLTIAIIAGIAVVGVAIAAYIAALRAGDETRSTVATLQKQLQDKDAEAERARVAKQQADLAAREREAQAREDQRKRSEEEAAAAKPIPIPNYNVKPKQPPAERTQPPKNESVAKSPSGTTTPKASPPSPDPTSREIPASQPAAPVSAQPLPAPESAKPSPPPTPREQLANADRMFAAKQFSEGLAILRPLAEAGNAQAQTRLGNAYAEGLGVSKDYAGARDWYDRAARQGEIGAALKLGAMYANGTGVDANSTLAYIYYGMAVRLGSAAAKPEMERAAASLQPAERKQADRLIDSNMPQKE